MSEKPTGPSTFNVSLSRELATFVRERVDSGLYASASEVVREALRILASLQLGRGEVNAAQVGVGCVGFESVGAGTDDAAVDDVVFEIKVVRAGGLKPIFEMLQVLQFVAQQRGLKAIGEAY